MINKEIQMLMLGVGVTMEIFGHVFSDKWEPPIFLDNIVLIPKLQKFSKLDDFWGVTPRFTIARSEFLPKIAEKFKECHFWVL